MTIQKGGEAINIIKLIKLKKQIQFDTPSECLIIKVMPQLANGDHSHTKQTDGRTD